MTAVIRFADASLAACTIRNSSIKLRSTGSQPVCTRKTSAPRIDSPNRQYVSPFANEPIVTSPSSTPSRSPIFWASSRCDRPEKSISRFCGPRSIQCSRWSSTSGSVPGTVSRPGRLASSVVIVGSTVSTGGVALLVFLSCPGDGERARRDVFRDDRSRRNPSALANLDRSNERILDAGPDVVSDRRPALRLSGLVREVDSDVARGDVRVLADLRIADVRQMRNLGPRADARVLDLHERARLRVRLEDRAGAKVTERTNEDTGADLGVDRDRVRADLGAGRDTRAATEDGERMDRGILLELDRRFDPRCGGIDDRHAGKHVLLVDAVAELCRGGGELDPRVDSLGLLGGRLVGGDVRAVLGEQPHGVREVQLSLCVRRVDALERGPELRSVEDVDRGVHLGDPVQFLVDVGRLDDAAHGAVVAADDPAVGRRILPVEGEHSRGGARDPMRLEQAGERLGPKKRSVPGEDDDVALVAVERGAGREQRMTGAEGLVLNRNCDSVECVRGVGRGHDHKRVGVETARRVRNPVDEPAPEQRVEVLGRLRAHTRAKAASKNDGCESGCLHGLQLAGAPGFEPGITGPKPVALPLGYAPKAGKVATPEFYRRSPNSTISATTAMIPTAISATVPTTMTRIGTSATSAWESAAVQRTSRPSGDCSRGRMTK